jgi:hypothetical protein
MRSNVDASFDAQWADDCYQVASHTIRNAIRSNLEQGWLTCMELPQQFHVGFGEKSCLSQSLACGWARQ